MENELFSQIWSLGAFGTFISIAIYILIVVANCKIFSKAGEAWWLSLIPFVSTWYLFKIVTGSGAKMFLMIVPFVNIYYIIAFPFKMAKAFGYSGAFGFGLLCVPYIFRMILAFGDSRYVGCNTVSVDD